VWSALKQLAQTEPAAITESQAIKRVKAIARKEGAHELPERALKFYAQEYCEMVSRSTRKH
jgi:hypothetical protein